MVNWQLVSMLPVWALAIVGTVLVAVLAPASDSLEWLPIALAAAIILAFFIQLGISRKEGFVLRIAGSVTGAVIVLGVGTAVLAPIA